MSLPVNLAHHLSAISRGLGAGQSEKHHRFVLADLQPQVPQSMNDATGFTQSCLHVTELREAPFEKLVIREAYQVLYTKLRPQLLFKDVCDIDQNAIPERWRKLAALSDALCGVKATAMTFTCDHVVAGMHPLKQNRSKLHRHAYVDERLFQEVSVGTIKGLCQVDAELHAPNAPRSVVTCAALVQGSFLCPAAGPYLLAMHEDLP